MPEERKFLAFDDSVVGGADAHWLAKGAGLEYCFCMKWLMPLLMWNHLLASAGLLLFGLRGGGLAESQEVLGTSFGRICGATLESFLWSWRLGFLALALILLDVGFLWRLVCDEFFVAGSLVLWSRSSLLIKAESRYCC
ncbi:hypothetical protein Nepgr_002623 [Nepenthes gracilis]|uniref:Uncharacterized protein n=1 Tax=Nepenthes gracilis TaxID=150966 RepID=A0AAD3RXY1_NEPGR|nr:hypothetical protein Nepgr_002623 [Nepenthes gracilis]